MTAKKKDVEKDIVKLPLEGTAVLKTKSEKYLMPVRYKGKLIKVRHKKWVEFEVKLLAYEMKIHINSALKSGDLNLK